MNTTTSMPAQNHKTRTTTQHRKQLDAARAFCWLEKRIELIDRQALQTVLDATNLREPVRDAAAALCATLPYPNPCVEEDGQVVDRINTLLEHIVGMVGLTLAEPASLPAVMNPDIETRKLQIARDKGALVPCEQLSPGASTEARAAAIVRWRDANAAAYEARLPQLRREFSAQVSARQSARAAHYGSLRASALERIRAAMANGEHSWIAWFWLNEAYAALGQDPSHATALRGHLSLAADAGAYAALALERARHHGAVIAVHAS
jgi:hypothetical protein